MKNKAIFWSICTAFFLIVAFIIYYAQLGRYFTLEVFQAKSYYLKAMVNQQYGESVLIYCVVLMLLTAVSLPIIPLFALLGGYLYGPLLGSFYTSLAGGLGGVGAFILFRKVFSATLKQKYEKRFEQFNQRLATHGQQYILLLHYSLVVPFFVMNTLAALTNISLLRYFWITLLGLFPPCFIFAFAGTQFSFITGFSDVFSVNVIIAALLLMMLALLPMIIRWFKGPVNV